MAMSPSSAIDFRNSESKTMVVRKIVLALVAALCLGGICAEPALAAKEKTATEKNKERKEKVHAITTASTYLGVDPIYTSIFDGDDIVGTFMLGIGLDVPDTALRQTATVMMPMLRDIYVRTLLSYTVSNVRPWRQPDVEDLADRLQRATDQKMKRKGVRVLLAQVAIRLNN
jgi:flagellar basal body-associated protein FliL